MSIKQTTLWTDDEFQTKGAAFIGIGRAAWDGITMLIIQAILHYHEHSYNTARIKQVVTWIREANMAQMEKAVRVLLKGTTGMAFAKFTHNAKSMAEVEQTWEGTLEQCSQLGLVSFTPEKEGPKGVGKAGKKDKTIKVDGRVSDELANAMERLADEAVQLDLDGDTAGALAKLRGVGTVADAITFQNKTMGEQYRLFGQKLQQLEAQPGKTEATGDFKAETGPAKCFRQLKSGITGIDRGLNDLFQAVLKAAA